MARRPVESGTLTVAQLRGTLATLHDDTELTCVMNIMETDGDELVHVTDVQTAMLTTYFEKLDAVLRRDFTSFDTATPAQAHGLCRGKV